MIVLRVRVGTARCQRPQPAPERQQGADHHRQRPQQRRGGHHLERLPAKKDAQGELDAARALTQGEGEGGFAGRFAELRGDIAVAAGDAAAAAAAYQEALDAGAENVDLLRMKLADTGHAPAR